MTSGQYILNRWMVPLIKEICIEDNIYFTSYSDDWLIELTKQDQIRRIIGYKFDINNSVASTIASDKVAAYQVLNKSGIPSVEHRLVRTKAGEYSDWSKGLNHTVIKPLDGTSGHGVALLKNPKLVDDYIKSKPTIAAWAAAPFEEINNETRFIILDSRVICTYEKMPVEINGLKMFNLGLGATAQVNTPSSKTTQLALSAVEKLGLRLAAVDIIKSNEGYKVLEVNDGLMMENFMRQSVEYRQLGKEVYKQVIKAMFTDYLASTS